MRALALVPVALAAACFTPIDGGSCRNDGECAGAVCTRVGECASQTYALRVTWTVRGQAANLTGACSGIGELEIAVADPSIGEAHAVRPVPCSAGSFFYDKLPLGYTDVAVTGFSSRGNFLGTTRGTAIGGDGVVSLDLDF